MSTRKAAWFALGLAGCFLKLRPPQDAHIGCRRNADCPAQQVCEEARCYDADGARPPRLVLSTPPRSTTSIALPLNAIDATHAAVSLSAFDLSDAAPVPLTVEPPTVPASPAGQPSQVVLSGLPSSTSSGVRHLQIIASNPSYERAYDFDVEYGNDTPQILSLTVDAPLGIASSTANLDLVVSDASSDAVEVVGLEYEDEGAWQAWPLASLSGGSLATSASGVLHVLRWETTAVAIRGTTRLRITVRDALGGQASFETQPFIVDNGPSVSVISGPTEVPRALSLATFSFSIDDPNLPPNGNDAIDVTAEVSLDDRATWHAIATPSPLSTLSGGLHPLVWDLSADSASWLGQSIVYSNESAQATAQQHNNVHLRLTVRDSANFATTSAIYGPVLIGDDAPTISLSAPVGEQVRLVPLQVSLADSSSDPVSIELQFRRDVSDTWRTVDVAFGATSNLATSPTARSQVVVWQSDTPTATTADVAQGVGSQRSSSIEVRARARTTIGSAQHDSDWTAPQSVSINNQTPPLLQPLHVPNNGELRHGVQPIAYTLIDAEADKVDVRFEFSLDGGTTWVPCSEFPSPRSEGQLSLDATPQGLEHTFMWDTFADLRSDASSLRLRAIATDAAVLPGEEREIALLFDTAFAPAPGVAAGAYEHVTLDADDREKSLAVADFDQDGFADLAIGTVDDAGVVKKVRIYLADVIGGLATGTFSPGPSIDSTENPDFVVGDLEGDGAPDLVSIYGELFKGNGSGAFYSLTPSMLTCDSGQCPTRMLDLDNDGDDDLISSSGSAGGLYYWFSQAPAWAQGPSHLLAPNNTSLHDFDVIDVNGDGVLDVLFSTFDGTMELHLGQILATVWTPAAVGTPLTLWATYIDRLASADFDVDGHQDLLLVSGSAGVRIAFGSASGAFTLGPIIANTRFAWDVVVRDFDHDGSLDFMFNSLSDGQMQWHFGDMVGGRPSGTFHRVLRPGFFSSYQFGVADFNGDGEVDIAGVERFIAPAVNLYLSQSAARLGDAALTATTAPGLAGTAPKTRMADLNADGVADLLYDSHSTTYAVALAHRVGLVADRYSAMNPTSSPRYGFSLAVADFDLDGVTDFATVEQNSSTGELTVHRGQGEAFAGDGTFATTATLVAAENVVMESAIGDLDLDGYPDIVVSGFVPGDTTGTNVSVFLSNAGSFNAVATTSFDAGFWVASVTISDFDSDGHPDLLVTTGDQTLHFYKGAGSRTNNDWTLAAAVTAPLPDPIDFAVTADLDNDGYVDVVGLPDVCSATCNVTVVWGDSAWPPAIATHATLDISRGLAIDAGDIDGDGVTDIVAFTGQQPATTQAHVLYTNATHGLGSRAPPALESFDTSYSASSFRIDDVSFDGIADLAGHAYGAGVQSVLLGRRAGTWAGWSKRLGSGVSGDVEHNDAAWVTRYALTSRIARRRSWGARDDYTGTLNGLSGEGDFANLLRQAHVFAQRHVPLSSPWLFAGDIALRHVRDASGDERYELSPRFGPSVGLAAADAGREGLHLGDRSNERGVVIELPFIGNRTAGPNIHVYGIVKRYRTASQYPTDPLYNLAGATSWLPRLPLAGGGYRDVVRADEVVVEAVANDAPTLTGGTVVGKRFVVDPVRKVIRVLTDELGTYQAFNY